MLTTKKISSYIIPLILIGVYLFFKPVLLPYLIPAVTPSIIYSGGVYASYDDVDIPFEGDTVLFFHADWCPSCVRAEKNILASGIPAGLTLLKVDYDSHEILRETYNIRTQTSYVHVDTDGILISSWVGSMSIRDILHHLEK